MILQVVHVDGPEIRGTSSGLTPRKWTDVPSSKGPFEKETIIFQASIFKGCLSFQGGTGYTLTHLKRKIIWTKPPWLWVQNLNFPGCITWNTVNNKDIYFISTGLPDFWSIIIWGWKSPHDPIHHWFSFFLGQSDWPEAGWLEGAKGNSGLNFDPKLEWNSGSTIRTLLHDRINPKDCEVLSLGDSGFLQFFRVVSSDYGKPRNLVCRAWKWHIIWCKTFMEAM